MTMTLKVLLPTEIFADIDKVQRVVCETNEGALGLLPRRLDCVAALTPGILTYQTLGQEEAYMAIDEGILIKTGTQVLISTHHAIASSKLDELSGAVKKAFLNLSDNTLKARSALAKLESTFVRRFIEIAHE